MMVSGGMNVFAADVEAVIHQHPAVIGAAVDGMPHPRWLETPVAIIGCSEAIDGDTVRAWANARPARHQQIERVIVREQDFPRNALGKILKRVLREELAARPCMSWTLTRRAAPMRADTGPDRSLTRGTNQRRTHSVLVPLNRW